MADPREFVLIGSFQDGITPALQNINDTVAKLKTTLGNFGTKRGGFNDLTKSMGKVISAHKILKEEVKELRQEMSASLSVFKEYRREAGKVVAANMHLRGEKFVKKNNPHLQFLDEATKKARTLADVERNIQIGRGRQRGGINGSRAISARSMGGPRPVRGTPGANLRYSVPAGGGSPYSKERWGVSRDETFAFGQTLGFTLGSTITGAIVQGFQIGVGLMVKPFQMFAGALQERVQDELSDISAAGGLLSVAKRQKGNPLVKSFQDSMDLTQHTNKYMAEIAAALPGNTQQYIEVGKRMSDTAARMIAADPAKAIAYAQELAAKEGAGRVVQTQKDAYTQIIGNMATQGVLAGLGEGGAGSRGVMGAYGLPQLMERMYNEDEVTMGQFQRYAAIFRDPKIMDALERFIPKINATMKGTVDRARVFDKFFEEVLPPEMIRAFERSTSGIMEAFRTAIGGPETGLFGLGRKFENMGKKMDAYGRYLDKEGEVTDFANAANATLSLFDLLRDIFANISIALYPLIDILPQIFDPLKSIGDLLVDARHISGQFLQSFENYLAGVEQFAKASGNKDLLKTKRARAGLLAIANFMTDVGAFSEGQFEAMRLDILNKPSKELGNVLNQILTKFFESDMAGDLGNLIGSVVGTVLKQVATVIEYFLGIAETSKLAAGLKKGFQDAGGYQAAQSIIRNIFKALFKAILEIFKLAPAEFTLIGGASLLIPAFVSSFSVMLANWIENFFDNTLSKVGKQLFGGGAKVTTTGGERVTTGAGQFRLTRGDAKAVPGVRSKVSGGKGGTPGLGKGGTITTGAGKMGLGQRLKDLMGSASARMNAARGSLDDLLAKMPSIKGGSYLRDLVTGDASGRAALGKLAGLFSLMRERLWNLGDSLKKGATYLGEGIDDWIVGSFSLREELKSALSRLRVGISKIFDPLWDLVEGKYSIRGELIDIATRVRKGLSTVFKPLREYIFEGRGSLRETLKKAGGNALGKARGAASLLKGGLDSAVGGVRGGAAASFARAKGIPVQIKAWGGKLVSKTGGFMQTIPGNFMKQLKGKGGMFAAGVGIVDAIMALMSGDSLATALGKGAGPLLGSALGAALTPFFPPLGAFIGGWIGSMEAVTEPLAQAFEALGNALNVGKDLLLVLGGDINWLINTIRGTEGEFDLLRFAVNALLSPFKLLELGIRGLYVLYLKMRSNLDPLNKEKKEEFNRADAELAIRTADFAGKSKQQQLAEARERLALTDPSVQSKKMKELEEKFYNAPLFSAERQEASRAIAALRAQTLRMDPERDKMLVEMLEKQAKDEARPKGSKAILGGKEVEWTGSTWKPITSATDKTSPQANKTPNDIAEINKKATEQAKGITDVHKGTEKTTAAVKDLTAKITAQTSVQTTVAAIYNLLASGSLRVNGVMAGMPGRGGTGNEDFSDTIPGMDPKTGVWKGYTWDNVSTAPPIKTDKMVATNSGTMVEGNMTVNAPITVNGAGKDAEEIATLVALKIGAAVADARSASLVI